jgi:hypothetical protein
MEQRMATDAAGLFDSAGRLNGTLRFYTASLFTTAAIQPAVQAAAQMAAAFATADFFDAAGDFRTALRLATAVPVQAGAATFGFRRTALGCYFAATAAGVQDTIEQFKGLGVRGPHERQHADSQHRWQDGSTFHSSTPEKRTQPR